MVQGVPLQENKIGARDKLRPPPTKGIQSRGELQAHESRQDLGLWGSQASWQGLRGCAPEELQMGQAAASGNLPTSGTLNHGAPKAHGGGPNQW